MIVLQLHNRYLTRGGEDESREAEVRLLRERGHRVIEYVEDNARVAELGAWRTATRTLWSAESFRKVAALIRQEQPDVTVVHNFFPLISPSVYYASRRHGVPVVQYLRNYRLFCPAATFFRNGQPCELCLGRMLAWPGIRHRCYHGQFAASAVVASMSGVHRALGTWRTRVDAYVALSEFGRRKCIRGGIPERRLTVLPNFVHPDPGVSDGREGGILFVGRVAPEKGLGTLIDAWGMLTSPPPLRIVGDGPDADRLRHRTGGRDRIEWLGRKTMAETLDAMGRAQVLVVPSECYETFGRTAIEAYAKGTPVIAARGGAVEELVEDGRTGFLFDPGNAGALAGQLRAFLAMNAAARTAMRSAARQAYEARFTADRYYAMLMNVLSSVVTPSGQQTGVRAR
jgi:glycosyltransferase involved in cell wall biosynthesis